MFICSWNCTKEHWKVNIPLSEWLAVRSQFLPVICKNILEKINKIKLPPFGAEIRSFVHTLRSRFAQESAAHSPPTFMQIFAWNLIDSISAGSALWSWNYSLICFFSFAAAASLKSVASALSWSKFFYWANHYYFRKIKWKLFLTIYIQPWVRLPFGVE